MASPEKRLAGNAKGDLFVDQSCIDCGTCRWMAPESFNHDESGDASRVYRQPRTGAEQKRALQALVSCPVSAIGSEKRVKLTSIVESFPRRVADNVYHCGFHSERSFGAASYLVVRPEGNVLVDCPRFNKPLVRQIEALGGVSLMFLTHRDDVADHQAFRNHFGCTRVLHRRDVTQETREVERQLTGDDPVAEGDLLYVPTPGHTRGSTCLIYQRRFLFSGDHVAFSIPRGHVYAFRTACWYSWNRQIESMRRLSELPFEHMLPGHGAPCHYPADEMRHHMAKCVRWMQKVE